MAIAIFNIDPLSRTGFSLQMNAKPIKHLNRGPPIGFVIDGQYYVTVAEATRIVGRELTSEASMLMYARSGVHASGLELCPVRFPLLRSSSAPARSNRQFRYLLRQDRCFALREILADHRRHRYGPIRAEDFTAMKEAAKLRNLAVSSPSSL
jgi:hypothetical protein